MSNLITYNVVEDYRGKLAGAAKLACNFWNAFVEPDRPTVIKLKFLGLRPPWSPTTATANIPDIIDGTRYGQVSFRKKFCKRWSEERIAATIAHEIGHVLGYGFGDWDSFINTQTGTFTEEAIAKLPALATMRIQLTGGDGVEHSHWDETAYDPDLMTPYKDEAETVMPITLDVLELFGHRVKTKLAGPTPLSELLQSPPPAVEDWDAELADVDRDQAVTTGTLETLPHGR